MGVRTRLFTLGIVSCAQHRLHSIQYSRIWSGSLLLVWSIKSSNYSVRSARCVVGFVLQPPVISSLWLSKGTAAVVELSQVSLPLCSTREFGIPRRVTDCHTGCPGVLSQGRRTFALSSSYVPIANFLLYNGTLPRLNSAGVCD